MFIAGMAIAFLSESFFREFIQDIFQFSTSNKIQFVGKNIFFLPNIIFMIILGIASVLLLIENSNKGKIETFKSTIRTILLFFISIILLSSIDANLKVIECTACENGIRKLNWNNINYSAILGTSLLISLIPSIKSIIKKR